MSDENKNIIVPTLSGFIKDTGIIPVSLIDSMKGFLDQITFDDEEYRIDVNENGFFLKYRLLILTEQTEPLKIEFPLLGNSYLTIGKPDSIFYFDITLISYPYPKIEIDNLAFGLKFSKDIIQAYDYLSIDPSNPNADKQWKIDETQEGFSLAVSSGIKADIHGNFDVIEPDVTGIKPFMIGNTGFIVDLVSTSVGDYINKTPKSSGKPFHLVFDSIPDEIVEDVPPNFKGLWIKQAFVYYHKPDSGTKIPPIGIQNAAIGEGGFSCDLIIGNPSKEITLSAEKLDKWFKDNSSESSFSFDSDFAARMSLFGVDAILWSVRLSFYQSIPNAFSLSGVMRTGLSDQWIVFKAAIAGPEGDIFLEIGGLPDEPLLDIETDWYKIVVDSIAYKMDNNIHYAIINGGVQLKIEPLDLPLLKVDKLSVGSDGSIDIEGGWAEFPETVSIDFVGFKVELKELGMGTEGEGNNIRQWFGFSGGIKLLQGLEGGASVEGLKVSWEKETGKDIQVELKSIAVDLEIPDALKIQGKISYDKETGLFRGMVDLDFQSLDFEIHGELIVGKTTDQQGREFSVFYIAMKLKSSIGIMLGATGLSLYGIAGLFGVNVRPNKTDEQSWYDWYKAAPAYNMIANSKWVPAYDHFALGVGVNIGTMYDGGYSLSADIMLAILIPGPVIMLEGKADLLKVVQVDAIALPENNMSKQVAKKGDKEAAEDVEKEQVGNFYMLAVIDGNKGTFQLNIDIKIVIQELVNIGGSLEAFFDFNDAKKWYIHIGVKDPESKRIQAEVLAIFSASTYFMIRAQYIKFGAAVVWGFEAEYGPVRVALRTAFAFDASLIFNPFQAEAEFMFLAELGLRVFCFDFGILLEALLQASMPKPYRIYGKLHVKVGLPWPLPSFEFDVELEWEEKVLPEPPKPLLKGIEFIHHKTKDFSIPLLKIDKNKMPDWSTIPFVPIDGRPVLQFSKPLNNDYDLGCTFRDAKRDSKKIEAIEFEYLLLNEEGEKVKLEVLVSETPEKWVEVLKGFSDDKEENTFKLYSDSFLNGLDAQEPNIQLWQYRPMDMAGKTSQQGSNTHCKYISPVDGFSVNFENRTVGEKLEKSFTHDNVIFFGSGEFSISMADNTTALKMKLSKYMDQVKGKIGTLTMKFPEPITTAHVFFSTEHIVIPKEGVLLMVNGEKIKDADLITKVIGDKLICRITSKHKFDTVSISLIYHLIELKHVFIEKIDCILPLFTIEPKGFTPGLSNVTKQNSTFLEAGKKYRLSVPTQTKIINGAAYSKEENLYYFQTDYGPGLSNIEGDKLLEYHKEPFHQFKKYIATTSPDNGAKNYYYNYNLLVQFNEAYVQNLFDNNLKLIVQDQNYKTVLEIEDGVWLDNDEINLPALLNNESITQSIGITTSGNCRTVSIGYQPVQSFPLQNLRSNRRYFCKIEAKKPTGKWKEVYDFEFVTSQYKNFTEHILGVGGSNNLRTMLLDYIQRVIIDEKVLVASKEEYKDAKSKYSALNSEVASHDFALALENLNSKKQVYHKASVKAYDTLIAKVENRFKELNIFKELPNKFELVLLEMQPNNSRDIYVGKELQEYIVLFESPEPIEWERLEVTLKGKGMAIGDESNTPILKKKDLENLREIEPEISDFELIPKTNFDFLLKDFPQKRTELLISEIAIAKRLDKTDTIKKLVETNKLNDDYKTELFKLALKVPLKQINIETELTFIWNEDKTSAFAIFKTGTFNESDQGLYITRGDYSLEFNYNGNRNPELGMLLDSDSQVIDETISLEFVI